MPAHPPRKPAASSALASHGDANDLLQILIFRKTLTRGRSNKQRLGIPIDQLQGKTVRRGPD